MFRDRGHAGERLAAHLAERLTERGPDAVVVLGIPRGGMVVAAPVARTLQAAFDVIVPRKVGAPDNPELAVAAVALAGPEEIVLRDEGTLAWLGIPPGYVEEEARRQRHEIERREQAYRGGRAPVPIAGRTVVLVDDGIATGLTARAAAEAVARSQPRQVILAVPLAPRDTVRDFAARGLRLEALESPSPFLSVGRFYDDFRQVEDDEVRAVLASHSP
ncbi:MAG TPA: phosphoribosyltransferase family protein [Vicinamibacteria bacterium]